MFKNKYNLFAIAAIFVLISILAATNWRPDTFLTGWDNLHPEFNFAAHISRSIFGTWQEYQGLGTVGGMGLAADLPRQVFLFLLSFILPMQLLRDFFHFSMLFVGTVGAYLVVKEVILYNLDEKRGSLAGFVGSIFYLFNLATLQMFYVPFEPFSAHFGFLPWLIFTNVHFFRMKDKKSLAFLLLVNILAIPQNSVATFFYVYFITLLFFLGVAWHLQRRLKEVFIALFLLISVNAFWLFPNMYYVANKAKEHINAKVNLMATEDSFLLNKKYGNLENTMLMKGFWFDNKQTDVNGKAQYQMGIWRDHVENPLIKTAGYSLFFLCLVGIYFAFKKRVWGAMFFSPMLLFAFTIISNDTPVFAQIAGLFYKLPLFSQVFRFPFTKFAILTVFMLSFYFAICFAQIYRYVKQRWLKYLIFGLFVGLPMLFCYPMFLGKLFYDRNRIKIPQEYFQVFDFFKRQNKNERIANLPQHQYWEWTFYRWGYQGAGILWNGIEQPTLDRAFDVWGKENENYYHEISYAVYSGNAQLFHKILDKYQVRWLLLDRSVINPNSAKAAYTDKLEKMIRQFTDIQLVQTFGNVSIYQVSKTENPENYVFLLKNAPSVVPTFQWNNNDTAYSELGNYYSSNSGKAVVGSFVYYPFRSLFTGRRDEDREFIVEDNGDYYSFKTTLPKELIGSELLIPPVEQEEVTEVNENDLSTTINKMPSIYLDGELVSFDGKSPQTLKLTYINQGNLEIRTPKIKGLYSYTSDDKKLEPQLCDEERKGQVSAETFEENGENIIRLQSLNSKNCVAINLPELSNRIAYLTSITTRHVEGKPLLFWWENLNARRGDVENYLRKDTTLHQEYYLQPPMEQYGLGYTLHFDNASIGRVKTVNDLGKITVNPIPYRFLTSLKVVNENGVIEKAQVTTEGLSVDHPNPSFYQVSINNKQTNTDNQMIVLSQSYDDGWRAYEFTSNWLIDSWYMKLLIPLFGMENKDHILVNNWENGWEINGQKQVTIVLLYLPQYLEYLGFGLLVISILYLLLIKQKKTS